MLFLGEIVLDMLRTIILFLGACVATASFIKILAKLKQLFISEDDVMVRVVSDNLIRHISLSVFFCVQCL